MVHCYIIHGTIHDPKSTVIHGPNDTAIDGPIHELNDTEIHGLTDTVMIVIHGQSYLWY